VPPEFAAASAAAATAKQSQQQLLDKQLLVKTSITDMVLKLPSQGRHAARPHHGTGGLLVGDSRGVRTTAHGGQDPGIRECGVAARGAIRSMAFAGVAAETAADPALAEGGGDGLSLCPA